MYKIYVYITFGTLKCKQNRPKCKQKKGLPSSVRVAIAVLLLVLIPISTKEIVKENSIGTSFYYLKPAVFLDIPSLQLIM